jgi:hypothetical protein
VSVRAVLYPRWPPLLKIENSSNGQNCSILSQKVPKFELFKHNDGNNSKMGNQIYFKIAGYVDLDMLNMFAVSTYHLSLIVFEIKDEKY